MTTELDSNHKYQVGLSLPANAHTYVMRRADNDLYKGLMTDDGKFCYILSSRQTGKTSLMGRTMRSLQAQGVECAAICTSGITEDGITEEQWYIGLLDQLVNKLNLSEKIDVESWWYNQRSLNIENKLIEFFEKCLLPEFPQKKIVVLIDEIDGVINLSFSNILFNFIQSCYKKRKQDKEYKRLNFAIFGVATLSELVGINRIEEFNKISQEIELSGFEYIDTSPLEKGIKDKVSDPRATLNKILEWTNGQPLLTKRICRLIQDLPSPIPKDKEKEEIDNLVRTQIIENWRDRDNPEHLRTIYNRILGHGQRTRSLLELYQEILKHGEISADESSEQQELQLIGLVRKEQKKLKVANKIYESIFNRNWVAKELDNLFPYIDKLNAWFEEGKGNNSSNLLKRKELEKVTFWAWGKENISSDRKEFIDASKKLVTKKWYDPDEEPNNRIPQTPPKTDKLETVIRNSIFVVPVLVSVLLSPWISRYLPYNPDRSDREPPVSKPVPKQQQLLSSGEHRLFSETTNLDLNSGIEAFKSGNYAKAIKFFEKAVVGARNDPEAQIYLNNARAREQGSPFTLAVVVPVDNQADLAKEILRGVADAQTQFNKENNPLMEVVIANDGNKPDNADKIAEGLARKKEVSGVISHDANEAKSSLISKYENADLPLVSISSDNIQKRDNVFSTVPSVFATGKILAEYARNDLKLNKVVIFYDKDSNYSINLKTAFEGNFQQQVVQYFNFRDPQLSVEQVEQVLRSASKSQVQAVVLLPSFNTTSIAISVAKSVAEVNKNLPPGQKFKLLGGEVLYHPDTLINGGEAIEGLVLAVPWFAQTPYAKQAEDRWGGKISWRTASSYDATQVLIEAGHNKPPRQKMQERMSSVQFLIKKTSGYKELKFSETGERSEPPCLVQATKGQPSPPDSKFGFQPLTCVNKTM